MDMKVVEFYVRDAHGEDVLLGKVSTLERVGRMNLVKMAESIGVTGWNYAVCGSEKMYISRGEKDGVVSAGNVNRFVMNRGGFLLGIQFVEGYKLGVGVDVPRVKGWSYPVIEVPEVDTEEKPMAQVVGEAPTGSEGKVVVEEEKPKSRGKKKKD